MANVYIVGTRGVPNRYGGFERLAEVLGPYLVSQGHQVTVFCLADGREGLHVKEDRWCGVRRKFISVSFGGVLGTLEYDLRSILGIERGAVALIFGYGTAVFQIFLKLAGIRHCVNMDGFEWKRAKWGLMARSWLRLNECVACRMADLLVADHPEVQRYLLKRYGRQSVMIAYGSDSSSRSPIEAARYDLLNRYGAGSFFLVIARPEPENQIHLILDAYAQSSRRLPMVVVGDFSRTAYGRALKHRHPDVDFVGAIYDECVLNVLRRRAALYLHGHSVGGTNPSLVEAMAAGALIAAHDNVFNRWVAGSGALFFRDRDELVSLLDTPLSESERQRFIEAALQICRERFSWSQILREYGGVVRELAVESVA